MFLVVKAEAVSCAVNCLKEADRDRLVVFDFLHLFQSGFWIQLSDYESVKCDVTNTP